MVLEYIKVFFSTPVVTGIIVITFFFVFRKSLRGILDRFEGFKAGGTEVSTPRQSQQPNNDLAVESRETPALDTTESDIDIEDSITLTPDEKKTIAQLVQSERNNARIWEFKYLSYFLVRNTQEVIDWFSFIPVPITADIYNNVFSTSINSPDERLAILNVLESHYLIVLNEAGLISITDKGKEYLNWRGPLLPITPDTTKPPAMRPGMSIREAAARVKNLSDQ